MSVEKQVDRYIAGVLDGTIPTGLLCRLAVQRHVLDLEIGGRRGLSFDPDVAAQWCEFFPTACVHTTGEYHGQRFELRDFQAFFIWVMFGWKRADGLRRFRDALISFGRGNGKSPIGAGIILGLTFLDIPREPRAEGYCVATKQDQAMIVWEEARRMRDAGPLKGDRNSEFIRVLKGNMHTLDNQSKLTALGSDSDTQDGLIPHGVIRDELHAWKEQHRGLYEKIETAMGKRRQPMGVTITTAGTDRSEIWKEQHTYSSRVVSQVLNPPAEWFGDDHFSFICEVDKDDDIYDEANWPKANPMLLYPNSPVKIEHLRKLAEKAKSGDIAAEVMFRRYHCNQLVSSTEQPITPELWAKGNIQVPSDAVLLGVPAYGGIDMARSNDFAAITLLWSFGDDRFAAKTWAWTVRDRPDDLRTSEFEALLQLENLTLHSGNQIEFADVRKKIVEIHKTFNVRSWGFDDNFARETGQWLQEEHGIPVTAVTQSPRGYNESIVKFIDVLSRRKFMHGGCPLLGWQAGNLILRRNAADLRMPDKVESPYKIDSMVALFMAFSECLFSEKSPVWTESEIGL